MYTALGLLQRADACGTQWLGCQGASRRPVALLYDTQGQVATEPAHLVCRQVHADAAVDVAPGHLHLPRVKLGVHCAEQGRAGGADEGSCLPCVPSERRVAMLRDVQAWGCSGWRRYAQLFRTGGSGWGAPPARQAALGVAVRSVKSCPGHRGGWHTGLITAVAG